MRPLQIASRDCVQAPHERDATRPTRGSEEKSLDRSEVPHQQGCKSGPAGERGLGNRQTDGARADRRTQQETRRA